jgi:hypothetical protein
VRESTLTVPLLSRPVAPGESDELELNHADDSAGAWLHARVSPRPALVPSLLGVTVLALTQRAPAGFLPGQVTRVQFTVDTHLGALRTLRVRLREEEQQDDVSAASGWYLEEVRERDTPTRRPSSQPVSHSTRVPPRSEGEGHSPLQW